jgi:hypothetical protein
MHRIEIDRAQWGKYTLLDKHNGKMCCLGFICKQAGLSDDDIQDVGYPSTLWDYSIRRKRVQTGPIPDLLKPFISGHSDATLLASDLARINDSTEIDDAEREARLIERAAKDGFEFVFTGTK